MFATSQSFIENQLKCIKNKQGQWEYVTAELLEEVDLTLEKFLETHITDDEHSKHQFSLLMKVGVLQNEVLLSGINWQLITNYRMLINWEGNVIESIPIKNFIKYFDFIPNQESASEALNYLIELNSKVSGQNLENKINSWFEGSPTLEGYSIIYIDEEGEYVFKSLKEGINTQALQQAIAIKDYLDISDIETNTIFRVKTNLEKRNPELEELSYNTIKKEITKRASVSEKPAISNNKSLDIQSDNESSSFYQVINNHIYENLLDQSNSFYSKLKFGFESLESSEIHKALNTFEEILKEDIDNEIARFGKSLITITNNSNNNFDPQEVDRIISKFEKEDHLIKSILELASLNKMINIGVDLVDSGVEFAIKKREQMMQARQQAAGAVLSGIAASNVKNKTVKSIGYGVAGYSLIKSGSNLSQARESDSQEQQYFNTAFNILNTGLFNLKALKSDDIVSKLILNYETAVLKNILTSVITKYHQILKTEFSEHSSGWGVNTRYGAFINTKIHIYFNNFINLLTISGCQVENKLSPKFFKNISTLFSFFDEERSKMKKIRVWSKIIALPSFLIFLICGIYFLAEPNIETEVVIIALTSFAFFIFGLKMKHSQHDEMKNIYFEIKKEIDELLVTKNDLNSEHIGIKN